VTLEKRNTCS